MKVEHYLTTDEKLKIIQDTNENNFTFDSLLLANFVNITKKVDNVVDLCAGNAPIAMLLTRHKEMNIKAIELQTHLADLATESIKINSLQDQIEVYNDNLIGISEKIGKNKYQLVTCNPPYFLYNENSNTKLKDTVAIARHEIEVNFEQIVIEAKKLLDNTGVFCFVHRPQRLDELILTLYKYNFVVKRMQLVYPKANDEANTVLIEAKKGQSISHMKVLKPLIIYNDDNSYTKDALQIVHQ